MLVQRGETVIEYADTGEPKWKLVEDRKFAMNKEKGEGQWMAVKMPADEELNTAKLDELKTALDDLKIVDVSRKPAGLSADLKKAADFTTKNEAFVSLAEKGFFLTPLKENGPVELVSNEGEIRIDMKDGVEYVLRFGDIAGSGPAKKDRQEESEAGRREGQERKRHEPLLVRDGRVQPGDDPQAAARTAPPAEERRRKETGRGEKTGGQEGRRERRPDDKKAQDAERERIEKENKRKQEEYDQKIADGKKRVGELNARFADWYYVISDEVFRKIHLGHDEIFKKKEKPKEEAKEQGQKKDEHAGHDHGAAKDEATPAEKLDKMQKEGPGRKVGVGGAGNRLSGA